MFHARDAGDFERAIALDATAESIGDFLQCHGKFQGSK
jgi:hypothetical protein